MGPGAKLSAEQWAEALELHAEGWSNVELAARYSVGASCIQKRLARAGIRGKHGGWRPRRDAVEAEGPLLDEAGPVGTEVRVPDPRAGPATS